VIRLNLCILSLFISVNLMGQSFAPRADWRFDNFTSQNHFTSRQIINITFDKQGYLWVAGHGVQRFDGVKTLDFNSVSADNGGLKDNYTDLIADTSGRIWVSSLGLAYFDNAQNQFVYVHPKPKSKFDYAYALLLSQKKDYLWFVGNSGLQRLNLRTFKISPTSLTQVTDPLCSFQLDDNTLLVSSREKVYLYHIKENTYKIITLVYKHALVKIYNAIKKGNDLYLGTTKGLFKFEKLKDLKLVDEATDGVEVTDLLFLPGDTEKKFLLFSTNGKGLKVYNTLTQKIEFTYLHDDDNPNTLVSNKVSKLFIDKTKRLWIATDAGLSMLDLHNQQWKMRFLDKSNTDLLYVYKVAADKYDSAKVWVASYNLGMIRVDWKTKQTEKIYNVNPAFNRIGDFEQSGVNKFLVSDTKSLFEWNTSSNQTITTKLPVADSILLKSAIRRIIKADEHTYYLATNIGLFLYNDIKKNITAIAQFDKEGHYYDLLNGFYNQGVIWIASRNGIFKYNIAQNKVITYTGPKKLDFFNFDIAPAGDSYIVCAAANGISVFNKTTEKFVIVNTIAGLTNLKCTAIIAIKNTVWIESEAGLLTYDIVTGKSAKINFEAGQVYLGALSPMERIGTDVVFGIENGYVYFNPEQKNNPAPTSPIIESVTVNSVQVPYKTGDNLVLNFQENFINIAFTAFLYNSPDYLVFKYKLKGGDGKWHYAADQRNVNFAQLPPGNYTFYLQGGNKNGLWNSHIATLNFVIRPPFWAAWWFRILVVLVFAYALYSVYRYKIKHIKAIESIRHNIASDFHDDLGSTLSSISIFSEVAIQKAETDVAATKSMVGDIGLRARAMIHSMNDMVWTIKPENDNLYKLMQRMEEFSYPVAEAREVQLAFLMDEGLYQVKTDMIKRKYLFLIFKEAFNNAIKYSHATRIDVCFKLKSKGVLIMQVSDNGCGFDVDSPATGNGLTNMQKRAAEIKGKLKVNPGKNGGTIILMMCKIT
jgi:ligand-binding sensor domain-containing protein/two-component sensor histidine kinase